MERERNYYAAPQAVVEDFGGFSAEDLESRKAGRGERLAAFVLDLVAFLVGGVVAGVGGSVASLGERGEVAVVVGLLIVSGLLAVNAVLLHRDGQTLGKKMLGIKIVRSDGDRAGLGRIVGLRILPVRLLGVIPYLGLLISLIDVLMIFGAERRCIHDMIADTIVIQA